MRQKFFLFLARLTCSHPVSVLLLWLCAASVSVLLASHLKMMTGRTDLLSPDNPHVRRYTDFTREFGTANNIYFIVESDSLKKSKQCAEELAAEIEQHPKYIRDVLYRLNFSQMEQKFFLHLSRPQLEQIDEYLQENKQFLKRVVAAQNLNDLFPAIGELAKKRAQNKFEHPATVIELRAFGVLLDSMNSYLWEKGHDSINFFTALATDSLPFGMAEDSEGYLVGKKKQAVVLAARPNAEKEDSIDFLKPMMEALLEARENALKKFPGVTIGVTGLPTFAYGDLHVIEEEMPVLFLLALLAAVVLVFLFFRHPTEIFFSGISLVCALLCTIGAAYLLIGHLNIMSSVFAVTLVSLGIDFGIHFIARFNSEFSHNNNLEEAMQTTFTGSGPAIATGALTTAAAFFMLYFTEFRGLAELGLIAGTGILLCLLSMLTILPSLIVLRHKWRPVSANRRAARTEFLLDRILNSFARTASKRADAVIAGFAAGTLLMCFLVPQVSFDYNFLHIQPKSSTTGEYEDILMERTGLSPSFAVIVDDDLQSLEKKVDSLSGLPSIARIDAATYLVPLHQSDKIDIIDSIRRNIISIEGRLNGNHTPPDMGELVLQFRKMEQGLAAAQDVQTVL
jgi:predicted RND superfamily exporter protein